MKILKNAVKNLSTSVEGKGDRKQKSLTDPRKKGCHGSTILTLLFRLKAVLIT
jgi:hypothetical protein